MRPNLLIAVLGNRNAGKTTTWNSLFEQVVRTGTELRRLYLNETEYVEVFLVSGSPEERGKYVGDLVTRERPRIVLCSLQYRDDVADSFRYFIEREYSLYIQWLNPGYRDAGFGFDALGLVPRLLAEESVVSIRDGTRDCRSRVREIREFICGWARGRDLVLSTE